MALTFFESDQNGGQDGGQKKNTVKHISVYGSLIIAIREFSCGDDA